MAAGAALGSWDPRLLGLAVALGAGLLVGLERERRKGQGAERRAAGLRTFVVASLAGALAALLPVPAAVPVVLAAIAVLAALAYWRSHSADPGLTTEAALVVTALIGALAQTEPAMAAGSAVLLAMLLAARERLHRFATQVVTDAEVHDALLLAALVLVLWPLTPADPVVWLGGLAPRSVVGLVVVLLLLHAAGHVAQRAFGARLGVPLSGFLGGFAGSTATIATLGARQRAQPAQRAAFECGALLSTAATWIQALLILLAVAPALARALLAPLAAGLLVALVAGAWRGWRGSAGSEPAETGGRPLRLREALLVALILLGVVLAVGALQRLWGAAGLWAATALGALADAHASVAAVAALQAGGSLPTPSAAVAVLVAIGANSIGRSVVALASGGRGYGLRVAAVLWISLGAAAAAWGFR